MGKFVMECPNCGRYNEAKTGFFAKKKIDCVCGYTIHVKTEKMTSRVCMHCRHNVVFDQSKGNKAICPVCKNQISIFDKLDTHVDFTCPSCSCLLSADKKEKTYVCPLCDTEIDVSQRLKEEELKNAGHANVIKYEGGNDVFVWKHPIEDFNLGSQLIVHESQEAIFLKDGKALDAFSAGRYTLTAQALPKLDEVYKLPSDSNVTVHSEVYFVNMTTQMGLKWGTDSKVRLFDPASGLHIELGACGNFNIRVIDSKTFLLKVVGTEASFTQGEVMGVEIFGINFLTGKFRALIMNKVKANLARVIKESQINVLEIDGYMDVLSEKMRKALNETLTDYGLYMPEFFITNISTPDDDPNFRRLKEQFAAKTLRVREEEIKLAEAQAAQERKILEAQTDARLKMVGAQGEAEALKIKAQAEADAYRMQAFAEADEMKAKGYTYNDETHRQVSMEALKNGLPGSGVNFGGSVVGDVIGLGVALGTVGAVTGMAQDALSPLKQPSVAATVPTTPVSAPTQETGWDCACGVKNISSKFCPECGAKKPEAPASWTCPNCGTADIKTKFCPECGTKKPEIPASWTCPNCGTTDIKTKFCPECGTKFITMDGSKL